MSIDNIARIATGLQVEPCALLKQDQMQPRSAIAGRYVIAKPKMQTAADNLTY
jgi:hypothetical protein